MTLVLSTPATHTPTATQTLPKFSLPLLGSSGTYRAFELSQNTLEVAKGTVLVGCYIQNWMSITDGTPCIIVSAKHGVVFSRVFNRLGQSASLQLEGSEVKQMEVEDVLEIWEAKAYIASTFPISDLALSRLTSMVLDLQQQVGMSLSQGGRI